MAFSGKRVLITGGAGGLGLEIGKKFQAEKATVILVDKDELGLSEAKKEIPGALTYPIDLLDWEGTKKVLETIGHVDHLVNNAGVNKRQGFLEVTPEALDFIFGVNFRAIVNVSQVVAKKMLEKGTGGTIVNISSFADKSVLPSISMYSASKAAVTMLTKSMAVELGPTIRVNCICPTYMVTPLTKKYIAEFPDRFDGILKRAPIKRFLEPSETADSVLFLSGPTSSMITGTSLDIDGGYAVA